MPIRTMTTSTTFSTGTTSAFQYPEFTVKPTSNVGYYIEGTDLTDYLWGSAKNDTMHGYSGNDVMYGQGGSDTIFGENGNDQLFGDIGNDKLDGGAEDDWLDGGAGADILIGSAGTDTASYFYSSSAVTVELGYGGFGGEAEGDTYSGIENVLGSSWNDLIIGDAGNNRLEGGDGNDQIIGGVGNDTLIGGLGKDILTGDSAGVFGFDTFVIDKATFTPGAFMTASTDTITDLGGGDKILLKGFSASDLGTDGKLAHGTFDLVDHGMRFAKDLDTSDHLFANGLGGLFFGDVVVRDGEFFLENVIEVVDTGHAVVTTETLLFV